MNYKTEYEANNVFKVLISFKVRLGERKENVLYLMHMVLTGKTVDAAEFPTIQFEIRVLEHRPLAITRHGVKEIVDVPFIAENTIATDVVIHEIQAQLTVKPVEDLPLADYDTWDSMRHKAFLALTSSSYDPNVIKANYRSVLEFRIYCLRHAVPDIWKTSRM